MKENNRAPLVKQLILTSASFSLMAALYYWLLRRWKLRQTLSAWEALAFKPSEQGLSEAEAAERRSEDRIQARRLAEKQAFWERIKSNFLSIFNLTILVLAISLAFLKDPLGAVLTLVFLIIKIWLNIYQETRAARQVGELVDRARPMATVIRDGRLKSIDQDDVVVGDVLVAGRGDEILADGELLESANLTIVEPGFKEQPSPSEKKTGQLLKAGTYCTGGWAVYRVNRITIEMLFSEKPIDTASPAQDKTPLQKIVERVLYVLLVIAGFFYITLILEVFHADVLSPEIMALYRQVISITFSIAPGGLFFMIVINYALGSAAIARSDALVRNSMIIETLAQVSSICLIRHGVITGVDIDIEMLPSPTGSPALPESRVRQTLGNYVHSVPEEKFPLNILREALEGEWRSFEQQVRYLSIYGWEAATFSSADMPGSYVIGYPDVLKPYLITESPTTDEPKQKPGGKDGRGRLRKWLRRRHPDQQTTGVNSSNKPETSKNGGNVPLAEAEVQVKQTNGGGLARIRSWLASRVRRRNGKEEQAEDQIQQSGSKDILRLMFAYSPSTQSLYDAEHRPQCPQKLTPLCLIKFVEEVRPEVHKSLQAFRDAGVSIKILAEEEPTRALAIAQQLGLVGDGSEEEISVATGEAISHSTQDQLEQIARNKTVFAHLTPNDMIAILQALQDQGEYVAVVGSSITDLGIMDQANLSITHKGSSPSVLDRADIILLKNSANALTDVLKTGQRIVNGLMDVIKLNLVQIVYTLILLIVMFATGGREFYYLPSHGSAVGIFTVFFPSITLLLWASTGTVKRASMQRQLVHFVTPAAVTIALTVLLIDYFFSRAGVNRAYTQQVITHTLVLIGLFLVIFVQPPLRLLAGGDEYSGDWRPTYAAAVVFLIYQIAIRIPFFSHVLQTAPLKSPRDSLLAWGIALLCAILTLGVWRIKWLRWGSELVSE